MLKQWKGKKETENRKKLKKQLPIFFTAVINIFKPFLPFKIIWFPSPHILLLLINKSKNHHFPPDFGGGVMRRKVPYSGKVWNPLHYAVVLFYIFQKIVGLSSHMPLCSAKQRKWRSTVRKSVFCHGISSSFSFQLQLFITWYVWWGFLFIKVYKWDYRDRKYIALFCLSLNCKISKQNFSGISSIHSYYNPRQTWKVTH